MKAEVLSKELVKQKLQVLYSTRIRKYVHVSNDEVSDVYPNELSIVKAIHLPFKKL